MKEHFLQLEKRDGFCFRYFTKAEVPFPSDKDFGSEDPEKTPCHTSAEPFILLATKHQTENNLEPK